MVGMDKTAISVLNSIILVTCISWGYSKRKRKKQNLSKFINETEFDELESYIMNTFGEMENVFHEVYSPDIHVDIAIIPPNEHDHFYKLITMGIGAHDMHVPSVIVGYE